MNKYLIYIQDYLRSFFAKHELLVMRLSRGVVTLIGLLTINHYFGYSSILSNPILEVVLAVLCGFIPLSGSCLLLIIVLLVQIFVLSSQAALIAAVLFVIAYILCGYYGSRHSFNLVYMPLLYQLQVPFVSTLVSALVGSINEVTSVLCGGVITFYLAVIRRNASALLDAASGQSVTSLMLQGMFTNASFYYFLIAVIAMFLVTYVIRTQNIPHPGIFAVSSGILVEFVIMMIGYLQTGNSSRIPALIVGNVLMLVFGVLANYIGKGLDYSRIEKVQFEDDEYYYYVTAVPKIHMVREDKEVKVITNTPEEGE